MYGETLVGRTANPTFGGGVDRYFHGPPNRAEAYGETFVGRPANPTFGGEVDRYFHGSPNQAQAYGEAAVDGTANPTPSGGVGMLDRVGRRNTIIRAAHSDNKL